jgi:hypothetical protein
MKRLGVVMIAMVLSVMLTAAQENSRQLLERLESGSSIQQQQPLKGVTKGALRLFGERDDLTTVIMIVPNGAEVDVLRNDGDYLLVKYKDSEGFLLTDKVAVMQTAQPVVQQQVEREVQQQQQPQQQDRRELTQQEQQINRMTYLEHKYGRSIANRIYAGKIWKGMTTDMVKDAWGEPDRVNRVVVSSVVKEEMIYRGTWLLMEQGKLMEWGPIVR